MAISALSYFDLCVFVQQILEFLEAPGMGLAPCLESSYIYLYHESWRQCISVRVAITVMRHHDPKQPGEERVYLDYIS